ncbi:MAG: alpha-L-fucosidase, partial [Armatimonadetes bacterium]|nr:alpha-L-fucosidase [Armatimonadota bacterium]
MWFDGEWESTWNHERGQKLYNLCRKLQPNLIVNNRVDVGRGGMGGMSAMDRAGDYGTPEQEIPDTGFGPGQYWESCMTLNGNWGFNKADHNWKPTKSIVQMLADIASKGGNYLLNVGPMASGDVPPESIQRLKEVGDWMKVNSTSITGTAASPFSKPTWGRVTVREGANSKIYLHVFDWPASGSISLGGLGSKVTSAKVLGGGKVAFTQADGSLHVKLPAKPLSEMDTVVEVSVAGPIVVYAAPMIQANSQLFVGSTSYTLSAAPKGSEIRTRAKGGKWGAAKSGVPIKVTTNVTIEAQLFVKGKPVSEIAYLRFKKVEPQPATSVDSAKLEDALSWAQFKGKWEKVPNFATMEPFLKGFTRNITIIPNGVVEYVGQRISGFLVVPADEVYEFALGSDDGSNLWIDGKKVVDNDGLHSFGVKTGQIALAKGLHPIIVDWFNAAGGAELALTWGRPGTKLAPLTKENIRRTVN